MGNLGSTTTSVESKKTNAPSLVDCLLRSCQQNKKSTALVDTASNSSLSYPTALININKVAEYLKRVTGNEGSRIAILSLNSLDYYLAMWGCIVAGRVFVPCNFRLALEELLHVLEDSGSELLFVDEMFAKQFLPGIMKKQPKALKQVVLLGNATASDEIKALYGGNLLALQEIMLQSSLPTFSPSKRSGDDLLGLFYTGGTSGKAKGVMLSHANVYISSLGNLYLNKMSGDTVYLHVAPMFHLADAQFIFAATMAGASHVFMPRFQPQDMITNIVTHKCNLVALVPAFLQAVMQVPNVESLIDDDLKNRDIEFLYGGSPMPFGTIESLMQLLPKARFFQGFGMTECSPGISYLDNSCHVKDHPKFMTVGRPMPWVNVRICDEEDNEVPPGTIGEIQVKGPNVMLGYWNLNQTTTETLKGGWMHTGDGGYLDSEGYLTLCDRIKDMVKTKGENVFSAEVERVVGSMPQVALCSVIGIKDDEFGELVACVIVAKDKSKANEITLSAVKEYCQDRLAGYKMPRKLFIRESMPTSGAGKILKYELRKEYNNNVLQQQQQGDRKTNYT